MYKLLAIDHLHQAPWICKTYENTESFCAEADHSPNLQEHRANTNATLLWPPDLDSAQHFLSSPASVAPSSLAEDY